MSLAFSSKAGTLSQLQGKLRSARILPLVSFTVSRWQSQHEACLSEILSILGDGPWIVRSSSQREDGAECSNAGAFLSLPDISSDNLKSAVEDVIASYGELNPDDEVLVQPMLKNAVRSGVAISHDPNTSAPYRVINWSEGADTSAVTEGEGGKVWQQAAGSPFPAPPMLAVVVVLLEELLELFGNQPVDCEFAVTSENNLDELWLLQARPLVLTHPPENEESQSHRLQRVQNKVARGMQPHPFLMGQRTVYGVMPDWNPAEILGVRPKPLALSLYRELITDFIWA